MSANNGGPAFPVVGYKQSGGTGVSIMEITGGMTLRDYFAAKAMQSILTSCYDDTPEHDAGSVATLSYAIADAMLAERAKGGE